jgi:hypothetical protein
MATRTQAQAPARYEIWNVHSNHVSLVVNMRDHYAIPFTVEVRRRREVGNDRSGSPHDCRRRTGSSTASSRPICCRRLRHHDRTVRDVQAAALPVGG